MDKRFKELEAWLLSKKNAWLEKGVVVDEAKLHKNGHQYLLKLHSDNGFGSIALNYSSEEYYVSFMCENYNYDLMSYEDEVLVFDADAVDSCEKRFLKHLTWDGRD